MGKAAEGNESALKKLGLTIEKGRDNAETFSNALAAIEDHFGGAAESKLNTYSGAVANTSNSFREIIEQIGNLIVKNPVLIDSIREVGALFLEVAEGMKGATSATEVVGIAFITVTQVLSDLVKVADFVVRGVQTLIGAFQLATVAIAPITIAIRSLSVGFTQATKEFETFVESAAKNFTSFGSSGDGALKAVADGLDKVGDAAEGGLAKLRLGADGTVEPINKTTVAVKALSDDLKGAEERAKAFALSLVKAGEEGKTNGSAQVALAKQQADTENAINASLLSRKLIDQVEFLKRKEAIEKDFEKKRNDSDIDAFAKQSALIDFALAHQKISAIDADKARRQLNSQFELSQQKNDLQEIARAEKTDEAILAAKKAQLAKEVKATGDTFTALTSLTQTKSTQLFEIGKAASIASALIHTYEAIVVTMASAPYPFNIPLAIAQGIAGAVQVANIEATSPSFEYGGIVGGNSYTGDNIQANVNSGEMILNRAQQKNLFEMAQSGGGNASDAALMKEQNMLLRAILAKDTSVHIGGKTIVDTLRSELVSGRTFN